MPVVKRYKSYKFFFYSNEGSPRKPPHIHVREGAVEEKFWLSPEVSLASNDGFNAKTIRYLLEFVTQHKHEFEESWHEYFA